MTFSRTLLAVLLATLVLLARGPHPLTAADKTAWPQWRGPNRDGHVLTGTWPDSLKGEHLVEQWRLKVPPSYSGPIVAGETVYTTFTRNKTHEGVIALDRKTGRATWKTEWEGAMKVAGLGTSMGSWIRATPTLDRGQLFVAGMPDLLVSLDAKSGKERWRADFHQRYKTPLPELGFVCSPLVHNDGVFVQAADSFIKVDRKNGKSLFRCMVRKGKGSENMAQGNYSSPGFGVINGKPQLLVADIDAIAGVEPTRGDVLWRRVLDSYDQGCILAPIIHGKGIFTSTRASRTGHYPLDFENNRFTIRDGWKNKLIVYMSSPVIVGDHAFLHLKNGRFACVDLRDGKINWISNRPFGKYCSMVWQKDRILGLTNDGQLVLLAANPARFELLDSRKVAMEETWAHVAVSEDNLYIRERSAIVAYRWK
tara:strand:- start:309 stop:1580 length:1272 start_codon:yes stop_codon:yes gene_type:complete